VAVGFSPSGRTVAAANHLGNWVKLFEVATGQEQASLAFTTTYPAVLAYSPDGRILALNTEQGVKLLNLPLLVGGPGRVQPASLPGLWDDLANADAARAYRSRCRLLLAGPDTVRFLQDKLRPVREPPPDRLARLLQDLDSERYPVRVQATQELARFGEGAGPYLRKALARNPPLEVRRRVESLLAKQTDPRQDHALEILECLGDDPARQLLEELATGMPEARLTQDARASCARLEKRVSRP
jgi:hypothetical protein